MIRQTLQKYLFFAITLNLLLLISSDKDILARHMLDYWNGDSPKNITNIRSADGKFYAYIVLLFNENHHFINLIQEDSISPEMMQIDGSHIKEYNNYLQNVKDPQIKKLAELMLKIYLYPNKYDKEFLFSIENDLAKHNVIIRFSKTINSGKEKNVLDYCIFGRKTELEIAHPLFSNNETIYNIQPFIYYDEFSTSNSTFYFDMIYINPDEVHNDYLIAQRILLGKNVDSMFFVGARVTEDIKFCIKHSFKDTKSIKSNILQMFEIHELTHKILNNHYDYYDQVTGEELAFISTIYWNPYLGLSVFYSYLQYNKNNPHRIAAVNYLRSISETTGNPDLIDDPSALKLMPIYDIKRLTKEHFVQLIKNLKK